MNFFNLNLYCEQSHVESVVYHHSSRSYAFIDVTRTRYAPKPVCYM